MDSLLLDITNYLINQGLVNQDGVDIFRDMLPEAPDNVVVLQEYQGSPMVYFEQNVTNRSIQILVRNKSAEAARLKCLAIFKALKSDTSLVQFTEERWGQVYLRQTPFKIEQDKNTRVKYAFNIGVTTTIE